MPDSIIVKQCKNPWPCGNDQVVDKSTSLFMSVREFVWILLCLLDTKNLFHVGVKRRKGSVGIIQTFQED